ncbi:MAG: DUF3794 domain-containing protein [Eubacteriales bacterium]|nr:DUF3794 domain-containing protein [Eubacteriales bacterium]
MTYEKKPFEFEGIPDYALQPAKEADEYNFHYVPRGATNRFDPAAYEKILYDSVRQAAEKEEQPEFFTQSVEEIIPVAFHQSNEETQAAEADAEVQEEAEAIEVDAEVQEEAEAIEVDAEVQEEAETVEVDAEVQEEAETVEADAEIQEEAAPAAAEEAETPEETTETAEEIIPVFAKPPAKRPSFQPIFVPKTVPAKINPTVGSAISSKLRLIDMRKKEPLRFSVEEDILVPDVKPDLARILAMDGKIKLSEREIHTGQMETDRIRITGDLILQTLYVPEHMVDGEPIVAIESRIPFKNETEMKAGPYSDLTVAPNIESIDFTIINERKFRVKAVAVFGIKEYSNVDVEVFEGIRDEEVQMLKEKINLTDVALRKTEPMEVKDDLILKDNMPDILKILRYDVNVVENHKQITKEKAVINASVYCNILYLGAEGNPDAAKADEAEAVPDGGTAVPVLYQGKTEFTQFIRLDGDNNPNDQNPAGSKVNFNIASANLTAKEDGNGKRNLFGLDMNVETGLELYKNIEKEIVTDVYHHRKELQYETDEIGLMALGGSGVAEISAREIVNIPERYGNVDKVVYISGNINEKRTFIDQAKSVVEGVAAINLICTSADTKKTAFNVTQEIPFRSAMEIPGITPEMTASNDIVLKELWFDKINNKQIEVNAGILVNTAVSSQIKHQLVKNISFLDSPQDSNPLPGIILYIARPGDTIWKIAKKYRTTIDEIKKINEIETGKEIKSGTKILIVAKNH